MVAGRAVGPIGLNRDGTTPLEGVSSYGNSSLRQGIDLLKPKFGTSLGTDSGGWNHTVLTVSPGIPGDSGSAFLDAQGRALGVLSTLALLPLPLTNGVGDISRELDYANAHTKLDVSLVPGDRPFRALGG